MNKKYCDWIIDRNDWVFTFRDEVEIREKFS